MPPNRSKDDYRGHACHRCHRQKIKCSRETPCRNCALVNQTCTYPVSHRKVIVHESYLKTLENELLNARSHVSTANHPSSVAKSESEKSFVNHRIENSAQNEVLVAENSTAEPFVSKLRQIQILHSPPGVPNVHLLDSLQQKSVSELGTRMPADYEYFALGIDTSHARCTFRLPPYPYAVSLLNQFAIYLGHDWHWFCLGRFRKRLEQTYRTFNSPESKDRIWLCQLLIVLALGESVNAGRQPEIRLDLNDPTPQSFRFHSAPTRGDPPGGMFFEQALKLLNMPFEQTSTNHVEALNMIALYSNQLNRQKTAYMYAGEAARLCNMLQLHRVSASLDCTSVEREHRKRLWWSTYCLDRMTSAQLGLLPTLQIDQTDLEYPTQKDIPSDNSDGFADPDFLTARIQLTAIQANNTQNIRRLENCDVDDIENELQPLLNSLDKWKASLPAHLTLEAEDDLPEPVRSLACTRALANLHLRFNQCIILLLRPLLLRSISSILMNKLMERPKIGTDELNDICMRSARSNLRILMKIQSLDLLVRLGFMENMHLFTSLMIMCLAMSIESRCPGSFRQNADDQVTYHAGKDVLYSMVQGGSLAAKGHQKMLQEVEDLGNAIAVGNESSNGFEGGDWNVDEWISQLFAAEAMPQPFEW